MFTINHYFDNNVTSIAFASNEGPATVGVMAVGEYEFGTSSKEEMRIISGALTVMLPGTTEWATYAAGTSFRVEANQKFQVRVAVESAYLCLYS